MTTVVKYLLAPRERQVIEGLAEGDTVAAVARSLGLTESTAAGYLKLAKKKLHGTRDISAAVAVGYALRAIARPVPLDPGAVFLLCEERELVPLIARGLGPAEMASEVHRPLNIVRRDGRRLLVGLGAKNRPHVVKRAWQFEILTEEQVTAWLR
ncbi:LuxR C-terminal-related transcriptional regulator [Streptomyces noursei]|uniref:LuxR C-terminal-related transcriptional regulator n=1 Tax=Streptomyces noursei TaxID=1971 RepID=UPI0023B80482|nr:LuxR C-terminal-related transcriptional regulator [Streptomyces noursei]